MNFHLFTKVLIVDSAVANYESLIEGVGTDTEVIVLKAEQDGVAQITQMLGDRQNIQTLHILSHGESGVLKLGNTSLNLHSLERYAPAIRSWATALAKNADVLLYGCKVAAGAWGQRFVQQLSDLTGANVAASINLTGSAALGGDWNLGFTTGQLQALMSAIATGCLELTSPAIQLALILFSRQVQPLLRLLEDYRVIEARLIL